ncbi:hypothetical protein CQA53_04730 [Helicobacter didelphidarum]|uniref:Glycosyltransferase 2-like domain-containing protein n=1 Tax=Helicobacter didelphidarum TaxID=2040648 RepID=A0A3D8ILL6_9HELI|nr:hypothetical protein CQA53_04730 [Helicobacter didelphidarum]
MQKNNHTTITDKSQKIGIVIPIYNVAQYLRDCLDSVINQTYKNLSIILVHDGSTDNESLNIAKEYTQRDSRIILIDKVNGGQSSARNVGIDFFANKYTFAPSDTANIQNVNTDTTTTSIDTMGGGGAT